MNRHTTFWDWKACRTFIEQAITHYSHAPGWFTDWLDDLYIRLDQQPGTIVLDEIHTLATLRDEDWQPERLAVNQVYKMFDRIGRNTTGIAGY